MIDRTKLLRHLFVLAMDYIQSFQTNNNTRDTNLLQALADFFPHGAKPFFKVEVGTILYLQPYFKPTKNFISHQLAPTVYYASGKIELHFPARTKICSDIVLASQDIFFFFDCFVPAMSSITRGISFFRLINEVRPMVILDSSMNIISYNRNFEIEAFPKVSGAINFMHWVSPARREDVTKIFNNALKGEIGNIQLPHPFRKDEIDELIFSPLVHHEPGRGVIIIIALNRPTTDIQAKYSLTPIEIKIASLVQHGMQSKEIADELGNSVDTIKWHCKQIRAKLGLTGSRKPLRMQLLDYPPFNTHLK